MSRIDALQSTLAAEHAAVWLYGVLGGQTSQSSQEPLYDAVADSYVTHRGRRDQLIRWVRDADQTPVAAEVAYELPNQVRTAADVKAIGRQIEKRCAATYADLVARTEGSERAWATTALIGAALRELDFGATPTTLPGINA